METKVTEKIFHHILGIISTRTQPLNKYMIVFIHTTEISIPLRIMKNRSLMYRKNNSHSDFWRFQLRDSVSASIVLLKGVKDVFLNMIMRKNCLKSCLMVKKVYKCNFIGRKMIRLYRKNSIKLNKTPKTVLEINSLRKRAELRYNSVSDFSNSLRYLPRITPGTAHSARISSWLKSRCKYTRHLKFWFYASKDLKENNISLKNTTCNFNFIFRMVDFPINGFDVSEFVINHNLPEDYFNG